MPFADAAGRVPKILESVGQGDLVEPQSGFIGNGIEFMAKASWVFARKESGPRGTAVGGCNVALGEPDSIGSQSVNVWRWDLVVAIATGLTPALVIRVENQQVGFGVVLCANIL